MPYLFRGELSLGAHGFYVALVPRVCVFWRGLRVLMSLDTVDMNDHEVMLQFAQEYTDDDCESLSPEADEVLSEDSEAEETVMTSMRVLELQELAITKRVNHFVRLQLREVQALRHHMERHLGKQREQMQALARLALTSKGVRRQDSQDAADTVESCLLDNVVFDTNGNVEGQNAFSQQTSEEPKPSKDVFMLGAFVADVMPLPSNSVSPREVKELFMAEHRRLEPTLRRWTPTGDSELLLHELSSSFHGQEPPDHHKRRSFLNRSSTIDLQLQYNVPALTSQGSKDAHVFKWSAESRMESLQNYVDQDSETANRLMLLTDAMARVGDKREQGHPSKLSDRDVVTDGLDVVRAESLHKTYEDAKNMMRSGVRFGKRADGFLDWVHTEFSILQDRLTNTRIMHLSRTERLVENTKFKMFIISLIFLNALFIGVTSDISVRSAIETYDTDSGDGMYTDALKSGWWLAVDLAFNGIFFFELVVRIMALEGRFCVGKDWQWNMFDALIVSFSVMEMTLLSMGLKMSFIRVLRFARVLPSLRMLRLIRFISLVRKLRIMMMAIFSSRVMLMWSVIVLILEMFLFSIIFLSGVVQYIADAPPNNTDVENMKVFFGSLPMTILTLFMSVSGGVDYWEVLKLLLVISHGYAMLYMLFIVLTVLAVLNVINAIFVNDAMETTRMDKDLRMHQELDETKMELERLTSIFIEMDEKGMGTINLQDFLKQVERDDMKIAFALIGVHFADGHTFFKHLDANCNGLLSIDEFVIGCIRIKGGGILIDMDVRLKETKAKMKAWMRDHQAALTLLSSRVQLLCDRFDIPVH